MFRCECYPEKRTEVRPFYVELNQDKESDPVNIRVFREQWIVPPSQLEEQLRKDVEGKIFSENELHWARMCNNGHPWNLDVYEKLINIQIYPHAVTFWREDFIKWVIDAMNDKYEKEHSK